MLQAAADYYVGTRVFDQADGSSFCHAIAKFQQAVEKSIKALICSLSAAGVISVQVGYAHGVERFLATLVRLRRSQEEKSVQAALRKLLDANVRYDIRAIDRLAPRRPAPGTLPSRNTEYPYCAQPNAWRFPAQADAFDAEEAVRYRKLAFRLTDGCARIVSAVERKPR